MACHPVGDSEGGVCNTPVCVISLIWALCLWYKLFITYNHFKLAVVLLGTGMHSGKLGHWQNVQYGWWSWRSCLWLANGSSVSLTYFLVVQERKYLVQVVIHIYQAWRRRLIPCQSFQLQLAECNGQRQSDIWVLVANSQKVRVLQKFRKIY